MDKFQNKYRIPSARLQSWDYGANAAYFVTICTAHRKHYFGKIVNCEMHLNALGKIVETEWMKTAELRPDMNLEFGVFMVMPNHFHAIIMIGENEYNTPQFRGRDAMHCVSTNTNANANANATANKFGPQSKNLASIIRGFKSSVTNNARKIHSDFGWQSRFHDHIIRNAESFEHIQNYISNNPMNWKEDKFYS